MKSAVISLEPLVIDCPKCQPQASLKIKKGEQSEEEKRTERRLRVLAARGCDECKGSTWIVTDAGERVLRAIRPLIEVAVQREVSVQLRAMGVAPKSEERVDLGALARGE
jgi:hypothetical protein